MAKIAKEKFNFKGNAYIERTTFSADIELTLSYYPEGDFFYYPREEMKKVIGKEVDKWYFAGCDTRIKAQESFRMLLENNFTKKKFLYVNIEVPIRILTGKDISSKIAGIFYSRIDSHGLEIKFKRVMELTLPSGFKRYSTCTSKWEYDKGRSSWRDYEQGLLIEWTEEREKFLISVQEQLDEMCNKIVDFFNQKSPEKIGLKLESGLKLLK